MAVSLPFVQWLNHMYSHEDIIATNGNGMSSFVKWMAFTFHAFCKTHCMVSIWDLQLTSSEDFWTSWLISAALDRLLCYHYGTVSMSGAENTAFKMGCQHSQVA